MTDDELIEAMEAVRLWFKHIIASNPLDDKRILIGSSWGGRINMFEDMLISVEIKQADLVYRRFKGTRPPCPPGCRET